MANPPLPAMSQQHNENSLLLSLPLELRFLIYDHLFADATIHVTSPRHSLTWRVILAHHEHSDHQHLNNNSVSTVLQGILNTNSTIRAEALPFLHRHLTVHLSPTLAHIRVSSTWTVTPPRIAGHDLRYFRKLLRKVDLGELTYCHPHRAGTEVEDMHLGCVGEWLREVRFWLVVSGVVRLQFRCSERMEEGGMTGGEFAEVLREQWCEDEKRCLGLRERIEDVQVSHEDGAGAAGAGLCNRFKVVIRVRSLDV